MSVTAPAFNSWIVSRRQDLVWFQGSALAAVLLLVFFRMSPTLNTANYSPLNSVVWVLFFWGVFFDGTHVWGTYARSYLAPDAASRSALPGNWSWLALAAGPAVALVDYFVFAPGPSQMARAGFLFSNFLVLAYIWGYWHLVRQHYGFLVLYRRRAGETSRAGARLDSLILWMGCLYPYLRFSLTDAYQRSGLPQTIPARWMDPARMTLDIAFVIGMAGALALWFSGRFEPFRPGPKHLLLAIVIGIHIAAFSLLENLLTISATLTIFHNLQYHRIVWQYEKGLGRRPSGNIFAYLGFGTLLGLLWYGPRVLGPAFFQSDLSRNLMLGFGWSVAFHHYIVDGLIWRVRRSSDVARALDAGASA